MRETQHITRLRLDCEADQTQAAQDAVDAHRLIQAIATKHAQIGYPQWAANGVARDTCKALAAETALDRRVMARQAEQVARHDRTARVDLDGSIRPVAREAHKQATAYVVRSADPFGYAERNAFRGVVPDGTACHGVDPVTDLATAKHVVAEWASGASRSATGGEERRKVATREALMMAARAESCRDVDYIAHYINKEPVLDVSRLCAEVIALLGRDRPAATRHKLRKRFGKAVG